MAVVFSIILNRAVRILQQWIPSRKSAIAVLLIAIVLLLTAFGVIIVPPFIDQLQELINLTPQVIDRIQGWLAALEGNISDSLRDIEVLDALSSQIRSFDLEMMFGRFYTLFSNTLTVTLNALLGIVVTIMMLLNPHAYRHLFVKVFPSSLRQTVDKVLDDCEGAISGWFIGIK